MKFYKSAFIVLLVLLILTPMAFALSEDGDYGQVIRKSEASDADAGPEFPMVREGASETASNSCLVEDRELYFSNIDAINMKTDGASFSVDIVGDIDDQRCSSNSEYFRIKGMTKSDTTQYTVMKECIDMAKLAMYNSDKIQFGFIVNVLNSAITFTYDWYATFDYENIGSTTDNFECRLKTVGS